MATIDLRTGARRFRLVFPILAVLLSACAAHGEASISPAAGQSIDTTREAFWSGDPVAARRALLDAFWP
jgi:hypothetical protein